jgi:acyl-CoA synthetase (AMP-forming)/AMP-acid ligase II
VRQLLVGDVLWTAAQRTPRRIAATLDDRRATFAELATATEVVCRALAQRGIGHGSRVVWQGDTTIDAIPLAMALASLGAVFVPVNPRLSADEAGPVLDLADPDLLVDAEELMRLLASRVSTGVDRPDVRETDPHLILLTSGSTGRPKGVELSHRATMLRTLLDSTPLPAGPVLCIGPQFHVSGWQGPTTALQCSDEVVYVPRPDAEPILEAIDRRRVVRLYGIPAVWRRLLEADRSGYDVTSLRQADTGTSATTPELLRAIGDAFPSASTSIYYGSTEAGSACRLPPSDLHRKPGSVGPAALGVEARLDDAGELLVRTPFLMNGYFRDPEATAAAVVDGWYHTGDLAERDDEGYYSIVGRAKDIIRTGGETVAPAEVDTVLQDHPSVADAAVAGVPDPDWGEIVTAFVVLRPGAALDLPQLRSFCDGRLAAFKQPRRLVLVDEIPRTGATRQVQRRLLLGSVVRA